LFRKEGLQAPAITTVPHGRQADENESADDWPFRIVMGLGFTDDTRQLLHNEFGPWLQIALDDKLGDCIDIKAQLVRDGLSALDTHEGTQGFKRLAPKGWTLDAWNTKPRHLVKDYALILRHTKQTNGHRQVILILAGFTEIGTAAAGHYLHKNWTSLYEMYVRGNTKGGSLGDFALVVCGLSDENAFGDWKPDPNLPAITPPDIKHHQIDAPWGKRS
jgi:hypothetical protein